MAGACPCPSARARSSSTNTTVPAVLPPAAAVLLLMLAHRSFCSGFLSPRIRLSSNRLKAVSTGQIFHADHCAQAGEELEAQAERLTRRPAERAVKQQILAWVAFAPLRPIGGELVDRLLKPAHWPATVNVSRPYHTDVSSAGAFRH